MAARLPAYQRVLCFMASFSSVTGERRAAEGYVLELCSEICSEVSP